MRNSLGRIRASGDYDYDFRECVSLYTKTAGNRHADYLLVLEDWASDEGLKKRGFDSRMQEQGHDETITPNKRLKELPGRVLATDLSETYGTNSFVFIRPGSTGTGLKLKRYCAVCRDLHQERNRTRPTSQGNCVGVAHLQGIESSGD